MSTINVNLGNDTVGLLEQLFVMGEEAGQEDATIDPQPVCVAHTFQQTPSPNNSTIQNEVQTIILNKCDDASWESGLLITLREPHFLTYEALMFVSSAMHEHSERNANSIKNQLEAVVSKNISNSIPFQSAFQAAQEQETVTRHHLEATWRREFPCVIPEQVILNEGLPPSFEWINDPKLGDFRIKKNCLSRQLRWLH